MDRTLAALEKVEQRLSILVVAARNAALEAHARNAACSSRHVIRVFSYTDQVSALMRAADLLITKPGGLTISEAFAAGLPLLLHDSFILQDDVIGEAHSRCGRRKIITRRTARIPAPGEKTWLIAGVLAYHVVLLGDICFC